MKQKKDKTNIWIDIKTAASIIGLSEQTLKKQCRAGKFVFKIVKGSKGLSRGERRGRGGGREAEGGETVIWIYCLKTKSIFN